MKDKTSKKVILGAHVSTAGGLKNAISNAKKIGAQAIQIFGISPRQWTGKQPSMEDVNAFRELREKSSVRPVYLHAAYLVNLASPNEYNVIKSIQSLTDHLKVAELIGAEGLVFHVGSGKGEIDRKAALLQEVDAMKEILKNAPGNAKLIMENTAGGGDKIGFLDDMAFMHKKTNSHRVKICFDTAHAFEAGFIDEYVPAKIKHMFDEWDEAVGLENIVVIHANDSKTAPGSHHDKHENIGEGYIGLVGFKALAKEKRLWNKPWILEVPGFNGEGPDKRNVDILRGCFA